MDLLEEAESVAAAYVVYECIHVQIVHLRLRTLKVLIKLLNFVSAILYELRTGTFERRPCSAGPAPGRLL